MAIPPSTRTNYHSRRRHEEWHDHPFGGGNQWLAHLTLHHWLIRQPTLGHLIIWQAVSDLHRPVCWRAGGN